MPCSNPLQGYLLPIFKKSGELGHKFKPIAVLRDRFKKGLPMPVDCVSAPCRSCMFCRLESSRVKALRCTHEARMKEHNCFLTLTYSPEGIKECLLTEGGYSLVRKHAQDFIKRLRERFDRDFGVKNIRVYGCGEYGTACFNCKLSRRDCKCGFFIEDLGRPHFHFCLFGVFFSDRVYEGGRDGFRYYSSKLLQDLWPFGFSSVCDFSFETAAYVARYCAKKITGSKAVKHYRGRLPEFDIYPTRGGGLGKTWFEKYGVTDVIPTDSCIARYVKCGVPKYYDRLRSRFDPVGLADTKCLRSARAKLRFADNTYARLLDKEKCMTAKINCLVRRLES